jgi:hypothetical protein
MVEREDPSGIPRVAARLRHVAGENEESRCGCGHSGTSADRPCDTERRARVVAAAARRLTCWSYGCELQWPPFQGLAASTNE